MVLGWGPLPCGRAACRNGPCRRRSGSCIVGETTLNDATELLQSHRRFVTVPNGLCGGPAHPASAAPVEEPPGKPGKPDGSELVWKALKGLTVDEGDSDWRPVEQLGPMKSFSSIATRHQLSVGIVLVLSVALVTVLFSLVGTLSCCVLVGMMCGASRRWRWQVALVSLTFPAALAALHPIPKIGLPWHEAVRFSLICFGTFWATYLVTWGLMRLEAPSGSTPAKQPAGQPSSTPQSAAHRRVFHAGVFTAQRALQHCGWPRCRHCGRSFVNCPD